MFDDAAILGTMATRLPRRSGAFARAAIGLIAVVATLIAAATVPSPVGAEDATEPVVITLFWGDGCPHCAAEKAFLEDLVARRPDVVVDAYEVWHDLANQELFAAMAAEHGIEVTAVPTTFVGDRSWVGYSDAIAAEIEATVVDALGESASEAPSGSAEPTPAPSGEITLPVFGRVDASGGSLITVTAVIALVDGFNPCSLWVLSILLAMMLHSGSRRRLLAVGITFLAVAGAAYGLFMLGLFAVMDWIGYTTWLRVVIAATVGVFGLVAIKDYFWFGRGPTFSIPEHRKPEIARRSRELALAERSLLLLVPMTALLAAGVALLELPCTAGFPVMWNGILAARGIVGIEFVALLVLYLAIYLLDEAVLFAVAFTTMRATRMQERHGRALKLVAGTVMLALALVMLVAPDVLDHALGALAVFGAALGAAALVIVVSPLLGLARDPVGTESEHVPRSRRQRIRRAVR